MSGFAPQVSESCPPHDRRFPQSESRGINHIIGDYHDPDDHTAETQSWRSDCSEKVEEER